MAMTLNNKTILVTRPVQQAAGLCDAIEKAGGYALRFPTLEIVSLMNDEKRQQAQDLLQRGDIFIFVSQNAVAAMAEILNPDLNQTIIAVGKSTATALQKLGLKNVSYPSDQFNSEAVLTLLNDVKGQNIIIFSGENSRMLLTETLQARGAHVQMCTLYRRVQPMIKDETLEEIRIALLTQKIDSMVCTSNEVLQNFYQLLDQSMRAAAFTIRLIVISDTMVSLAKALGFLHVSRAQNASDDAIMAAINLNE